MAPVRRGPITGDLVVGDGGNGTLHITNGAAVSSENSSYGVPIGNRPGSMGIVTVDGPGSTFRTHYLEVASQGTGTLSVTNGAYVHNGDATSDGSAYIAHWSGSTGVATVDGAGSTWSNAGNLYIGNGGLGTLNIANSGSVTGSAGYVGYASGSTGVVSINSAGQIPAPTQYVGYSAQGPSTSPAESTLPPPAFILVITPAAAARITSPGEH